MDIRYSKQAEKFLKRHPKNVSDRIRQAISLLPAGDVKLLQGSHLYRLRVGGFRVIFDKDGNVIYIIQIDSRGQVYNR